MPLWIASAWHRFILRNEGPGRIVPPWHGRRILRLFLAAHTPGADPHAGLGVVELVLTLLARIDVPIRTLAATIILEWLRLIVGIGILTTIYGQDIKKRPLRT